MRERTGGNPSARPATLRSRCLTRARCFTSSRLVVVVTLSCACLAPEQPASNAARPSIATALRMDMHLSREGVALREIPTRMDEPTRSVGCLADRVEAERLDVRDTAGAEHAAGNELELERGLVQPVGLDQQVGAHDGPLLAVRVGGRGDETARLSHLSNHVTGQGSVERSRVPWPRREAERPCA